MELYALTCSALFAAHSHVCDAWASRVTTCTSRNRGWNAVLHADKATGNKQEPGLEVSGAEGPYPLRFARLSGYILPAFKPNFAPVLKLDCSGTGVAHYTIQTVQLVECSENMNW